VNRSGSLGGHRAEMHDGDAASRPMRALLVRHCESSGQEPEAPLTSRGSDQARDLAAVLRGQLIGRVVSSPYRRSGRAQLPVNVESLAAARARSFAWLLEVMAEGARRTALVTHGKLLALALSTTTGRVPTRYS
jgi:broad specificity phosphatase PhoE